MGRTSSDSTNPTRIRKFHLPYWARQGIRCT